MTVEPTRSLPISEWHAAERPREKLFSVGPASLSNGELLGLILGSGIRAENGTVSAVQVGQTLLSRYASIRDLASRDARELMRVQGHLNSAAGWRPIQVWNGSKSRHPTMSPESSCR
jgi:DNA repair protein RadC